MKQVETDRWYGHNKLPAHCTRQYIRGWEEEGPCDNCAEPMLSGDRCYYNASTEQYYCCLACLKESQGSYSIDY
jgi:hypothetical protein